MATIADLFTDLAGLRDAMRAAAGRPSSSVLTPDASLNVAIARALARFNGDFAATGIGTFLGVAGQGSYTPLPDGSHGFRHVFWPTAGGSCTAIEYASLVGDLRSYLTGPIDEFGTYVVPDVSAVYDIIRRRSWLRNMSDGGFTVVERAVYLDPVPGGGETIVFSYNTDRYSTALDVAADNIEPFLCLCEAMVHQSLAVGIGAITDVVDSSEGSSLKTAAPGQHLKMSEIKMREYLSSKPPISLTSIP